MKSGEWRVENAESDTQGPHAVKGDQWVGYDDTRMMAIKVINSHPEFKYRFLVILRLMKTDCKP